MTVILTLGLLGLIYASALVDLDLSLAILGGTGLTIWFLSWLNGG